MNKWMMIAGAAVVAASAAAGATLMLNKNEPATAAALAKSRAVEVFYYAVHPEFIVNYPLSEQPGTLMFEFTVAAENTDLLNLLERHAPEMRNDVLALAGDIDAETLLTSEGKSDLRQSLKQTLDELLLRHHQTESISDVFLTRFVAQ